MASIAPHFMNQPIKHSWTSEQRITLAILFKFYGNLKSELFTIWNYIYRITLRSEGFRRHGLPSRRLTAQISEFKRSGTGTETWNTVMSLGMTAARKVYRVERDKIEDAAQLLGISLILQLQEPIDRCGTDSDGSPPRPPRPSFEIVIRTKRTSVACTLAGVQDEPNGRVQSCINWYDASTNVRPSPKLRVAFRSDGSHRSSMRPRLLFRAFQPSHRFRARHFLTTDSEIPSPPRFHSSQFRKLVKPHLCTDVSYESPFLSLAESPKNALNRIERSPIPLSFAVFDIYELEDDMEERYGRRCGPYLVPEICRVHELDDLPKNYYGPGEFLVWGSIECEAVAILNTKEALELICVTESMSMMCPASGHHIGQCLRNVDDVYKELIARKLIKSYNVTGHEKSYNSIDYNLFVDAVYAATHGNRASSILSTVVSRHKASENRGCGLDELGPTDEENISGEQSREQCQTTSADADADAYENDAHEIIQALIDTQLASEALPYGVEVACAERTMKTGKASNTTTTAEVVASKKTPQKVTHQPPSPQLSPESEFIDLTDSSAELIDDTDSDEDVVLVSTRRRYRGRALTVRSRFEVD